MTFDTKKDFRELGTQPKGQADYVEQGGVIYGWSESNLQYERAWWLYVNLEKADDGLKRHVNNILRDRPFVGEIK